MSRKHSNRVPNPSGHSLAILGLYGICACGSPVTPRDSNVAKSSGATDAPERGYFPSARRNSPSNGSSELYVDNALDDEAYDESDMGARRLKPENRPHPFDSMSDVALREAFELHPDTLGSVSIGQPNSGQLMNGIMPKEAPNYHLVDPAHAWGTTETVESLCHALSVVAQLHPGTSAIDIGHLSAKEGGPLRPHRSHQSGRDVDIGLYYRDTRTRWYTHATRDTLDVPRTWTLIRTLATDTNIEMILLDRSLQDVIEQYAVSIEKDQNWVSSLFHSDGSIAPLIRHASGHTTHLHLRFLILSLKSPPDDLLLT